MKKHFFGVMTALLLFPCFSVNAQQTVTVVPDRTYDKVMESGYLVAAFYEDFPPYSWQEDFTPQGIDVDLARRIAERMGLELRTFWISPDETLEGDLRNAIGVGHYMRRGNIADILMRVPYDKRYAYQQDEMGNLINEMGVLFGPYSQEQWRIAYNTEQLDSVNTIAVLQYHPVGVEMASLPETYLSAFMQGRIRDQVRQFRNMTNAFDALAAGDVSAVMGMQGEIDYHLERLADQPLALAETGFPSVGKQQWDIGMAVRFTYRQLGYAIEAEIDAMVREGEVAELYNQHNLSWSLPAYYDQILEPDDAVLELDNVSIDP
jgi:ABC-type amino acid transport substrate-binding protein